MADAIMDTIREENSIVRAYTLRALRGPPCPKTSTLRQSHRTNSWRVASQSAQPIRSTLRGRLSGKASQG